HELFSLDQRPTAIFALTDVTAVGVLHAAKELGVSIPQDVSVMGYDDLPIASYMLPALTTVRQPLTQMGEVAADLLLESIRNPDFEPQKAVLTTQLIVRHSTAPPAV
ncbi:MAG: substrate-binding domain-containing protein, partial [Chloroflexota bacterium]